jgi:hypothetical protein
MVFCLPIARIELSDLLPEALSDLPYRPVPRLASMRTQKIEREDAATQQFGEANMSFFAHAD